LVQKDEKEKHDHDKRGVEATFFCHAVSSLNGVGLKSVYNERMGKSIGL
jgi:hypothetical protein